MQPGATPVQRLQNVEAWLGLKLEVTPAGGLPMRTPKAGDACALALWLRLEQESHCAETSAELLTSGAHTHERGAQVPGAQPAGELACWLVTRDSWLLESRVLGRGRGGQQQKNKRH
eukprot:scaffold97741_cov54-Phaeocystis_antarctica.AAC.2